MFNKQIMVYFMALHLIAINNALNAAAHVNAENPIEVQAKEPHLTFNKKPIFKEKFWNICKEKNERIAIVNELVKCGNDIEEIIRNKYNQDPRIPLTVVFVVRGSNRYRHDLAIPYNNSLEKQERVDLAHLIQNKVKSSCDKIDEMVKQMFPQGVPENSDVGILVTDSLQEPEVSLLSNLVKVR